MSKIKKNNETNIIRILPISRNVGKKEALNALKAASREENFIGKGSYGNVYKFKDKYIVKKCFKRFLKSLLPF